MIVDVYIGLCPDPGSTPGVSTIFDRVYDKNIFSNSDYYFCGYALCGQQAEQEIGFKEKRSC